MLRRAILAALILVVDAADGQQAPAKGSLSAADQAAAISAVREYALRYTRRLPDYTCMQTTRQIIARESFGPILHPVTDLVEDQLSFVDKEFRKPSKVNGRPVPADEKNPFLGTLSRGEFGNLLDIIFEPGTGADLRWDRMATLNRRRVYVLAYRVPQARGYALTESKRTIQVPFKGFVYADAETRAVVRIEMKCVDIPRDSEYTGADLALDYKSAKVGGQEFVLPAHFLLHFQMGRGLVTSEADYTAYRRFSADTNIQFEGEK